MHKKLRMWFIRYGNLIPQKHKLDSWVHAAPVEYGVYAFPQYYVESWKSYLRSIGLKSTDVFPYIEDDDGLFSGFMPSVSESLNNLYPISVENKPVKFEYSGNIWHHFYDYIKNPGDVIHISKSGEWVLTDIQTYRECLNRFVYNVKYKAFIKLNGAGGPSGFPISYISKDLCEVFIENPKQ